MISNAAFFVLDGVIRADEVQSFLLSPLQLKLDEFFDFRGSSSTSERGASTMRILVRSASVVGWVGVVEFVCTQASILGSASPSGLLVYAAKPSEGLERFVAQALADLRSTCPRGGLFVEFGYWDGDIPDQLRR